MKLKKIAILGSCVTRDLFDFDIENIANYTVSTYLSRVTLASMFAQDMTHLITPDMSTIKGFDDRRFINDLQKKHISILKDSEWDVLILDLIDERHATFFVDQSAITYTKSSKDYLDLLLAEGIGKLHKPFSQEMKNYTKESILKLVESLSEIQNNRPILLHKAKYATHYISDEEILPFSSAILESVYLWNDYLDEMYAEFDKYNFFSEIILSEKLILSGGNHKWELTPFHYNRNYYVELYRSILQHL